MIPGFDVESLNTLGKLIGKLERFQLEGITPDLFDPRELLSESDQTFFHVQGLASFWNKTASTNPGGPASPTVNFGQYMADLVIATHNQPSADLTMIMIGNSNKVSVYLSLGSEKTTRTLLEGMFPGIELEPFDINLLGDMLVPHMHSMGVITGIPSNKSFGAGADVVGQMNPQGAGAGNSNVSQDQIQLERVIRGMYGTEWAYVVQAHPRPRAKVVEERMRVMDLLTQVSNRIKMQLSTSHNDNQQRTTAMSGGSSQSYSNDMTNYRAQYLMQLLEKELDRHDQAMAAGQWIVKTYFGAEYEEDARRLSSLLLGALAGADSRPEPLRAMICQPGGIPLEGFYTFLNSHELGTLVRLPREEAPGYAVHDYVTFDVDFRSPADMNIPLGHIQQNGKDTPETFNISLNALTKHVVVIGVTGSGKTTTVMNLIDQVVEAKKPFLVIEPAKTEYRALHSALDGRAELRVYTLGNEMGAPFRLNPFEFETDDDPENSSLLTHIDFLKAVFNAAFPLYAPMPQVLEMSILEIYESKGWDLTSGVNRRITDWKERDKYPIYPTLTDLYYKVDEVTTRMGYHSEVESNVKGALKSRLGSLRVGSKGLMLDTARSIAMDTLLAQPTILELENIGNDDEKTFVMGLFLAKLYEYRRLQFQRGTLPEGFQHLIVFEEAHRLLKNTSTQVDADSANPRAQAIEVFTNMLSEVRAYGQGVLVAEQIPSKLAPDVLKNTNLKIVHRLIAKDDRQSIGQTMNLSEEQQNHLGVLTPGKAAVFAEGADHAYLVRLENYKRNITMLGERQLKEMAKRYASVKPYQAIREMDEYPIPIGPTGGPDPTVFQAAGRLLDTTKSKWLWANIILRLVSNPDHLFDILLRFSELIESEMSYLPPDQHNNMLQMIIVRGSAELMQIRGSQYGWGYEQVEEMTELLTRGLSRFAYSYTLARDAVNTMSAEELEENFLQEMQKAGKFLEQFTNRYKVLMARQQGPYAGCTHCPHKCFFRPEVRQLLSDKNREWITEELASSRYESDAERYAAVAKAAGHIVQSWFGEEPGSTPDERGTGVSYCAAVHTIARPEFTEYEQELLGNHFKGHFFQEQESEL